jgi:two-component system cell cycle sensor histidine kinase PleC
MRLRLRLVLPLRAVTQALSRAAEGAWQPIPVQGRGEAAAAIVAFNRMVEGLAYRERALQQAMADAEAARRTKESFLAHIGHELRTPLNAIIGFSHVMRDEMFGPVGSEQYRCYAGHINEAGARLLTVLNRLLDVQPQRR